MVLHRHRIPGNNQVIGKRLQRLIKGELLAAIAILSQFSDILNPMNRRDFLKSTAAAALLSGAPLKAAPKLAATDWVTLGESGVKVTRLAFGTGSNGGLIQRELGQEGFNRLVRHAYDSGIRFFETAESYTGMPNMLATALKGIPRDTYRLMTKIRGRNGIDTKLKIDEVRKALNTEYVDILLLHCVRTKGWAEDFKFMRDEYDNAKSKKAILSHGASCHGLLPLSDFPGQKWLDVALLRINHNGERMDNLQSEAAERGDVARVTSQISKIHAQGTGIIGMKLVGEGRFKNREDRKKALQYVFGLGTVNAVTIGYKSAAEIDEAIENISFVSTT